jgi:O-antigen/teichoic acid export membrane protein
LTTPLFAENGEEHEKHPSSLIVTALSVIGNLSVTLLPLILIPIFHQYLSSHQFGLWNTALAVGSVVVLIDIGIKSELLSRLSLSISQKDFVAAQTSITLACAVLISTIGIGLPIFSLLLPFLTESWGSDIKILVAVVAGSVVAMVGQVTSSILLAQGLVIKNAVLQIAGVFCTGLICYFMVLEKVDFWTIALIYSGAPGIILILATLHQMHQKHILRPKPKYVSSVGIKDIVLKSMGFFKITALIVIAYNSDIVVITSQLGFASAEIFSIPARLGSLFALIIMGINMPLWSILAAEKHDSTYKQARMLYLNCLFGTVLVAVVGVPATLFANEIIQFWIGAPIPQQPALMAAITFQNLIAAFATPFIIRQYAKRELKTLSLAWLVYILVSVPIKYFLINAEFLAFVPLASGIIYGITILPAAIFSPLDIKIKAKE